LDLTSLGVGGASGNSSGWNLDDEPGVPIDGILVLHLENGRDFFLTVAGTYRHSVFGKTLESLRSAAFPPDVPEPIRALADSLFDSRSSSALRPPARATLDEMSAVREVLERSHVSGATADVSGTRTAGSRCRVASVVRVRADAAACDAAGLRAFDRRVHEGVVVRGCRRRERR
jgi:hypothetical protein